MLSEIEAKPIQKGRKGNPGKAKSDHKKIRVPKGKAPKKFYYFNCYGIGEPIRMALNRSKTKYTDVRLGIDKFKDLQQKGIIEFGQVPVLELVDGTRIF